MEKATEIVDYAYPTMMAEKTLRYVHNAVLANDLVEAQKQALDAIRWAAEAHAALKVMEERNPR